MKKTGIPPEVQIKKYRDGVSPVPVLDLRTVSSTA